MMLDPGRRVAVLRETIALGQVQAGGEAGLGLVRALIESGQHPDAEACLEQIEADETSDWRVAWYRGLSLIAQGRYQEGQRVFDRLYSDLCGELAPKLEDLPDE